MTERTFALTEDAEDADGCRDGKFVVFEKDDGTYWKPRVRVVRYVHGEYVSSVTLNHGELYRLFRRLQAYVRGRLDWNDE